MNNKENKKPTKYYPYNECVEELINEELPSDIASSINCSRDRYGKYLSLNRAFEKADCFKENYEFDQLNKEMFAKELFEAFLKQDFLIRCNDGVDEDDIKHEDEGWIIQEIEAKAFERRSNNYDDDFMDDWRDGLSEYQQRNLIRYEKNYSYKNDTKLLEQCAKINVPYYVFFFGITRLFAKELVKVSIKKVIEEIEVKKLFRTVVQQRESITLNVSPTEFLNKLITAIFKSNILDNCSWWNKNIQFDGIYLAYGVDTKKGNEDDVVFEVDDIGHTNYAYQSADDYYKYALTKINDCYIYSDNVERYLKRIDSPIVIKTNKSNPKIIITDVILLTK